MPAGNLHAYLRGGGVEVMANSDNVMRGGLTPKHIDVDELLSVLGLHPWLRRADPADRGLRRGVALSDAGAGVRALADRARRHRSRSRGPRRPHPAGDRGMA